MNAPSDVLFDCDNTLLDNDLVEAEMREHLESNFGVEARDQYWQLLEALHNAFCAYNLEKSISIKSPIRSTVKSAFG